MSLQLLYDKRDTYEEALAELISFRKKYFSSNVSMGDVEVVHVAKATYETMNAVSSLVRVLTEIYEAIEDEKNRETS